MRQVRCRRCVAVQWEQRSDSHDFSISAPCDVDFDPNQALLLILLLRRQVTGRKTWTRDWILRRPDQGVYANLLQELRGEDPESFRQFHCLDIDGFQDVLAMVGPHIANTSINVIN